MTKTPCYWVVGVLTVVRKLDWRSNQYSRIGWGLSVITGTPVAARPMRIAH